MDFDVSQLSDDIWRSLMPGMVHAGMSRASVMMLVAARLAGVLFVGPLMGRSILTWPVRLGLVVFLTIIVAPQLPVSPLESRVEAVVHLDQSDFVPATSSELVSAPFLRSLPDLLFAILRDAGIGAALGVAISIFLSGLKFGGAWFDRHSGLAIGGLLNPESSSGRSAPAEMAGLFCVAAFLVMQPVNGHLLVVRLVLDSFRALPVGIMGWPTQVMELPGVIVQQSLILGLRIAMPFVVAMSLVDLTLAFVHRISRAAISPAADAIRACASILILAATFPGIQEAASSSLRDVLQTSSEAIVTAESHTR